MTFKKFKTEKILLASIVVLSLFIFVNAFSREIGTNVSSAQEVSGQESQKSSPSSNEPTEGEESQKENSQNDEPSEPSVASVPSVRKTQTAGNVEEVSEKSANETSQQSVKEASEASVPSEKSSEISEESIKFVEGYGAVVSREGNVALVKKGEKLFFLIPVEVESQVTLDEQGAVTESQKSFLNWLLAVFSF